MATVVVMPALGNSVESCLITTWLVKEGDEIKENDTLCDVETDKAAMEVPSTVAGTVLKLLWAEGDDVPVKDPLLVVGAPGEDPMPALKEAGWGGDAAEAPAAEEAVVEEKAPAAPVARAAANGASSPRARALAGAEHVDIDTITEGSGPHGRVIERDVVAAVRSGAATAAAARAGGVGSDVAGTGLGGRISTADLAGAAPVAGAAEAAAPAVAQAAQAAQPAAEEATKTPLKGIRKVIADRMMASLAGSAQLTYTTTANAAGLLKMRKKLKESDPALGLNKITIGDLVGFAAVKAALKHPVHNSYLEDGVLTTFSTVHMGFACDTPRGLLVPVVRDASKLSLREFSERSKELAGQAIEGNISPDDLNGATFTVSNLGGFGIESFTPILNAPQTAILGVDAIFPRATIKADGSVGVEQRIGFSLTADHRVIDGADAARYLQDLVRFVENIKFTVLG
ncbi:dihydrolipoamide acetyltransferase family protein [Tessaracoccus sp. OH4464_COT-324]|uniref:dihydrolipoamide acetyltransferase family protein n=1 Tax=Tessaracoccus sp. OH4464_COT-324 TaxID=2491059 RepID=UPI000F63D85A|nr:dihydrolipoamide acetyltransferase family protein [Tessaracoccus sp. OH4464_COT-324]RRD47281.1 2-oxo acid dehydrogenase subunit E2 [Tessaracoccus sp. OH4464_COT-324]